MKDIQPVYDIITRTEDPLNPGYDKLIYNFHSGQELAWNTDRRFIAVLAGAQGGKALCVNTPIATPLGFVPIGEIKEGDIVFDSSGDQCRVMVAHEPYVSEDCYRIKFDDGNSVVCDGDHLWIVSSLYDRARERKGASILDTRKVISTREIFERTSSGDRFSIDNCSSIKIENFGTGLKSVVSRYKSNSIKKILERSKCRKIFYEDIFCNSSNRLRILKFLMDKNGSVGQKGECIWRTRLEDDADAFCSLVASLGLKCKKSQVRNYFQCYFHSYFSVFNCDSRNRRHSSSNKYNGFSGKSGKRYISRITKVPPTKVRCLTVSSESKTYLCGYNMVPTHNTSFGPLWLHREIYGLGDFPGRGAGDYLAVTANFSLFKMKMLPAMLNIFSGIYGVGKYWAGDRVIELRPDPSTPFMAKSANDQMWGRIILRSAEASGGLESATAKAAWLDEAGQDAFTDEIWRAVNSRVAIEIGRILITTTLYNFGYLKTEVYDKWYNGDKDFQVVHFDSCENPRFSKEEYVRAKNSMPEWRFEMRYRGRYSRPAGMIYDCFVDKLRPEGNLCNPFDIPIGWRRYIGIDFGGVNTACVYIAVDPATGRMFCYKEYFGGDLTASGHTKEILRGEPRDIDCIGGAPGEGQWRKEFTNSGLFVKRPSVSEVEIGISRVYSAIKTNNLVFFNNLNGKRDSGEAHRGLLGEIRSYSRKVDSNGMPTSDIDQKSKYHKLDALRYVVSQLVKMPEETMSSFGANPLALSGRGAIRRITR